LAQEQGFCLLKTEIVAGWGFRYRSESWVANSRQQVAALFAKHRLPAVYPFGYFVTAGGLISYGPSVEEAFRPAAGYVDRILKGEKPAELPVQTPEKYELVINHC
jgi:putative tryptophan/tyrosine transport system substrate-binding protein